MASKQFACNVAEVSPEAARIVKLDKFSIGIFKLDDGYHALLNVCPHRGAALCEGPLCGTAKPTDKTPADNGEFIYDRAGEIIRCAWHGWECDIKSGRFLIDPSMRVRKFETSVEGDKIYVHI